MQLLCHLPPSTVQKCGAHVSGFRASLLKLGSGAISAQATTGTVVTATASTTEEEPVSFNYTFFKKYLKNIRNRNPLPIVLAMVLVRGHRYISALLLYETMPS